MPRSFLLQAVSFVGLFGNRELLGHMVEQVGQTAELVIAENRPPLREIALGHRPRPTTKRAQRNGGQSKAP